MHASATILKSGSRYHCLQTPLMPKRPRAHILEDLSRNQLRAVFEKAGWVVEDLVKDYGEDFLVRIFQRGRATPLNFFVQIKATDNLSPFLREGIIRFPIKREHLLHWKGFQEPVILAIWDARTEDTYWVCVQNSVDEFASRSESRSIKQKTLLLSISTKNVLDKNGLRRIEAIVRARHQRTTDLATIIEEKLGVSVRLSSNGEMMLLLGPNGTELRFSRKTLAALEKIATKRKSTVQKDVHEAIEQYLGAFDEYRRSGLYPVLNPETGNVEMRRFTERQFANHLKRRILEQG